jgi:cadmium resistance protein CadD (predicted permease)
MSGAFNIIIGIGLIVAGLTGRFALLGTNSKEALIVVGLIPLAMGLTQAYKARRRRRGDG